MSYEATGKLIRKYDTEVKSSAFQTREFVIEVPSGNFNEYVKFQLVQERCNLIDQYQEGDLLKVSFDLRGREWQGKYFTNLQAWRIERAGDTPGATPPSKDTSFPTEEPPGLDHSSDDLPF